MRSVPAKVVACIERTVDPATVPNRETQPWMTDISPQPTARPTKSGQQVVFSEIGTTVRRALGKLLPILMVACGIEAGHLWLTSNAGALAFTSLSASSLAVIALWRKSGQGLPFLALMVGQNLVLYGLPIVAGNEELAKYSLDQLSAAGWEVACFNLSLLAGWSVGMRIFRPGSSLCYALLGLETASNRLTRLGVTLLTLSTAYVLASAAGLLTALFAILPAGSAPLFFAGVSAMGASGLFLTGMMVGRGQATRTQRLAFWVMLAVQSFVTAGGFLLSASVVTVSASIVGLFWGSGRMPWRLVITFAVVFSFLNLGKFTMRDRYWSMHDPEEAVAITLADMPRTYSEWITASSDILLGNATGEAGDPFAEFDDAGTDAPEGQSLLHRVNNLSNLLYVIDAIDARGFQPLGGATYTLIPPLLLPRFLWPNKPRTHQGQIMLNVHFGRQDLHSTYRTYVAWGLLPEAYGNFGALKGAMILGLFLGFVSAWIELATLRKMVLSLEGFLAFTTFLILTNAYEMVASVFVTALFQALVPIVVATAPFVARISSKRLAAAPP